MPSTHRVLFAVVVVVSLTTASLSRAVERAPIASDAFWKTWGDGQGEIATYRGTRARYGETRETELVVVTVTEDFSAQKRVKADPGKNPARDVFPVLKVNVSERFTTGVYEYSLMTSTFVSLSSSAGVREGTPAKVSFSAQEWCGHVYHQLLFDERRAREALHSYFDGEQDRLATLATEDDALVEDALFAWARGLAWPHVENGETRQVAFLPALSLARLSHTPLTYTRATLRAARHDTPLTVPAGTFDVDVREVVVEGRPPLRFFVERGGARRIVRVDDGAHQVELVAATRMPYWQKNTNADRPLRAALGLDGARAAP